MNISTFIHQHPIVMTKGISRNASLDSVPLEIQDMILPLLTLHDLTICVRVCHSWHRLLNPLLWRHLHLGGRRSEEEMTLRKGYARFRDSVNAGALLRSGMWVRSLDSTCCQVVDTIVRFRGTKDRSRDGDEGAESEEEEEGGCRELRELIIVDNPGLDPENWKEEQSLEGVVKRYDWSNDEQEDEAEDIIQREESPQERPKCSVFKKDMDTIPVALSKRKKTHPILTLIRQNPQLKILKLGGEMMLMIHDLQSLILDALPESIEHVELWDWKPATWHQERKMMNNSQYLTYMTPDLLPSLPKLTRLVIGRGIIEDNAALDRILKRCPQLETLCLHDQEYLNSEAYQSLAMTIQTFCRKVRGLHLINCAVQSEQDLCVMINACRPSGLSDFGYPCPPEQRSHFGSCAARALLEHVETLENLRLDGCASFPSEMIQKLLCSAKRLKRFDAISRFRFNQMDVILDANDIVLSLIPEPEEVDRKERKTDIKEEGRGRVKSEERKGWACLGLESFKCRIGGVPRPDVLTRTNGRPLTSDLHTSSTPAESFRVQNAIYGQLGQLGQLKELILGYHEVNMNYVMFLDEMDTEGEYYDFENPNQDIQGGFQYECLDMRLKSGMGRLEGCRELRRIGVEAMEVGFWRDEEQKWVQAHWQKLDWGFVDGFWRELGYADYY